MKPRVTNAIYKPLWQPKTRYLLVTGGRGSGKSDATSLSSCEEITTFRDWVTLYTRWTLVSAEISIIPEFRDKIDILGRREEVQISGNVVRSLKTGSTIIFSGIKAGSGTQTARLKSIKGLNKLIIEEAEEFREEKEFNTLDDSIRQVGVPNIVVIVMNPQDTEHWIWARWFEKSHRMVEIDGFQIPISTHPDITHIHTTYLDNVENLSADYLDKINRLKVSDPEAYAHRYLGKWLDKKEGVIYPNWIEGAFDESLPYAYGLDLGFSPDPLALVKVAVDTARMKIYIQEEVYKTRLDDQAALAVMLDRVIPGSLVVNDTSEPRLIDMFARHGLNMQNADKGKDSIKEGIRELSKFQIIVTPESYNAKYELRNYIWNDKKASIPIDANNHCFVGETKIETIEGLKRIDEMETGDLVLTSSGQYERVLKVWDNGIKQVSKYLIQFDTFSLSLTCTDNHLIKTSQGWKQISELKSGMTVYLSKSSMEKSLGSFQENDIFQEEQPECTQKSGSFTTVQYQKDSMYITKTKIRGITQLKILNVLRRSNIYLNTAKNVLAKIRNGLKIFKRKGLPLLLNGIEAKKEGNGIQNMEKRFGKSENQLLSNVKCAKRNTKQSFQVGQSFVIKTVKLKPLEQEEKVYDLTIEEEHEYFANGILVHNCMDGMRYAATRLLQGSDFIAGNY